MHIHQNSGIKCHRPLPSITIINYIIFLNRRNENCTKKLLFLKKKKKGTNLHMIQLSICSYIIRNFRRGCSCCSDINPYSHHVWLCYVVGMWIGRWAHNAQQHWQKGQTMEESKHNHCGEHLTKENKSPSMTTVENICPKKTTRVQTQPQWRTPAQRKQQKPNTTTVENTCPKKTTTNTTTVENTCPKKTTKAKHNHCGEHLPKEDNSPSMTTAENICPKKTTRVHTQLLWRTLPKEDKSLN